MMHLLPTLFTSGLAKFYMILREILGKTLVVPLFTLQAIAGSSASATSFSSVQLWGG